MKFTLGHNTSDSEELLEWLHLHRDFAVSESIKDYSHFCELAKEIAKKGYKTDMVIPEDNFNKSIGIAKQSKTLENQNEPRLPETKAPLQQLLPQVESKVVVANKPKIDLAQLEEAFWNGGEQAGDQLLESLTPRTLKGLLKNSIVRRKPEAPPAYEERSKYVASSSFSNGVR